MVSDDSEWWKMTGGNVLFLHTQRDECVISLRDRFPDEQFGSRKLFVTVSG